MPLTRRTFLNTAAAATAALPLASQTESSLVYFGTYTRADSKGIYVSRLDAATGKLTEPEVAAEIGNPSFVALHPNGRNLYAVSELGTAGGQPGGTVTAYSINRSNGKLTQLNQTTTKGTSPCHLNVDKTGKSLVLVNYGTGSTASYSVKPDGSLSDIVSFIQHTGSSITPRQKGPHAHSANISFDNRFVVVADLGLDQVLVYKFDPAKATLTPNDPPFVKVAPGSGPRHFTFHPKGRFAYVINEIASTVTAFTWDAKRGTFTEIQTISTLPDGWKGNTTTAEVVAHPNGKFLYGSNRGHNSLAVFTIDPAKGTLTRTANVPTQGEIPRNFAIDPTGKWLLAANQNTSNVVAFSIDQNSGDLKPTGQILKVGSPVCIRYLAV
jgi:6-phosphogluconolactonase